MDKFLAPPESLTVARRRPWKRYLLELNGRMEPNYRHELYNLIAHSYSEIGIFPHLYHLDQAPCQTHITEMQPHYNPLLKQGLAGLEFDNKGIYIVSVTRAGCLTVHDFESLYCHSKLSPGSVEDESKHVVHLSCPLGREFNVARWNPENQNEVVCPSRKADEVYIFDISLLSPLPVEKLEIRPKLSITGSRGSRGLSDVAITNNGDSRIFCPDTVGLIHGWDKRAGVFPCIELSTVYDSIQSIQIHVDNQIIFGAGTEGMIHIWDLRGGRSSSGFENRKEMKHLPLTSLHITPMLQKIEALKAQSVIFPKAIHSIKVNPSSPNQLAFHLDDGWSGVVDIYKSEITHAHCLPPVWLRGSNDAFYLTLRKPSWLPTSSTYVVGSVTEKGIHVLDFHPSSKSPCHVDYDEESQRKEKGKYNPRNKFVSLSEPVNACAAHPLNGMIVTGTQKSSLLLIAQGHGSSTLETAEDEP